MLGVGAAGAGCTRIGRNPMSRDEPELAATLNARTSGD